MKKTLKILMAIILFAVVLTIATSVNAAADPAEYDDFAAAVAAQANMDDAAKEIEVKGTVYTVKKALKLKDLKAPSGITIVTSATGTLEVVNEVKITSGQKFIFSGAGKTFTGGVVVNEGGVLYTDTAITATVYGRVYTAKSIAVTDTTGMTSVDLTLADAIIELPVKTTDDKKTEYTTVYVPKSTVVGKDSLLTIDFKLTVPGTDTPVAKLEAGKKYNVEATVKYKELKLNPATLALAPYEGTEKEANTDETFTVTDGKTTITIPAKLKDGDVINLVATYAAEKKEVALTVGAAPVDQNQPEQPETPANTDNTNKGDLDDSPKTGDHIIPAATLLAVVVVANVVYFAKSKNN